MTTHEVDWTPVDRWVSCPNTMPLECPYDPKHMMASYHGADRDELVCLECEFKVVFEPAVVINHTCNACHG